MHDDARAGRSDVSPTAESGEARRSLLTGTTTTPRSAVGRSHGIQSEDSTPQLKERMRRGPLDYTIGGGGSPLTETTTPSHASRRSRGIQSSEDSSPKERMRRGALDYTIGDDSTATTTSTSSTSSPACASSHPANGWRAATDAIHIDSDSSDSSGLSATTTTDATTIPRRGQRRQLFERQRSHADPRKVAGVSARPTHPAADEDAELAALVAEYRQSLNSRAMRTTPVKERRGAQHTRGTWRRGPLGVAANWGSGIWVCWRGVRCARTQQRGRMGGVMVADEHRYRPAAAVEDISTTAAEEEQTDEDKDSARRRRRVRARSRSSRAVKPPVTELDGGGAVSLLAEVRALLREMRAWLPTDRIADSSTSTSASRRRKATRVPTAPAYRWVPPTDVTLISTVPTTPTAADCDYSKTASRPTDAAPKDMLTALFRQMASVQVALEEAIRRDCSVGPEQPSRQTLHSTSASPTPPSASPVAPHVAAPSAPYEEETVPSAVSSHSHHSQAELLSSSVDATAIRCMYPDLFNPLAPAQPSLSLADAFAAEPTKRGQQPPSTMPPPSPPPARLLTARTPPASPSPPLSPSVLAVRSATLQYDDWRTKRVTGPTETVVISQPTSTASPTDSSTKSPDDGAQAQARCV